MGHAEGCAVQHHAPRAQDAPVGERDSARTAVRDVAGVLTAVEITYLDQLGRRSASAQPSRKIIGVLPAGCAVRLCPEAEAMVVGEGVFTVLSAMRRFALPGWALLSAGNLQRWRPPESVRRLLIAADRGAVGEQAATELHAAAKTAGLNASIALPPEGRGDWNDLDQEE